MAEDSGFDEERVSRLASEPERSADETERLLLGYADAFLAHPVSIDEGLRAAMLARFRDAEIVELTIALALFHGFSKIAIALGPIPDDLPIMHLPMPDLVE